MITDAMLLAFLDDGLGETDSAAVERELRSSDSLRDRLRRLLANRDRGEHSVGAIWRRRRLTCPTREQLGSFLLDALDDAHRDYIVFHLQTIDCPYCQANLADLKSQSQIDEPIKNLRRRVFDSSVRLLK